MERVSSLVIAAEQEILSIVCNDAYARISTVSKCNTAPALPPYELFLAGMHSCKYDNIFNRALKQVTGRKDCRAI